MTATIRVVLDQLVAPTRSDLEMASLETARALVEMAPAGCAVAGIVPSGESDLVHRVPGLVDIRSSALQRRELMAAWQLGVAPSVGGGMIHSPTIAAPLSKHDRVHDGDQLVVTVWDVNAWDEAAELPRKSVAWHRGMMRRVAKYADAVVVPTHALANRVGEIVGLQGRIRVIPGAAPAGFRAPNDADARARDLDLPQHYAAVHGDTTPSAGLADALHGAAAAVDSQHDVVVFGVVDGEQAAIADMASGAGIPERHLRLISGTDAADHATILSHAQVFVAASRSAAWPWRVAEALAVGVPIVATDTETHIEVLADGGLCVPVEALGDAVRSLADEATRSRLAVLSEDRGKSYSWQSAAERIWQLHAEL